MPPDMRLPILAMALYLSGCTSLQPADPAPGNVHDTLKILAQRNHVCGAAIAVIRRRKLDSMDAATGCLPAPTLDQDRVFQAASLSKPVFAYAVLKLVEQGKMAIDAPVMTYLPQGYRHRFDPLKAEPSELVTDPRLQAITVRMALNHTSGLPNWASGPLAFEAPPGTEWHYSGEGYVLLQRAVEAVTGKPLDAFMAAEVFQPLAMNHSAFVWNEDIAPRLLPGTKANGTPRSTPALRRPVAAFSLHTTAADYGKFLVNVLNDEALIRQITSAPAAADRDAGIGWGLGWGIEQDRDDRYLWQWGNNPGYRAFAIASVRTGDGFVMLTNSENGLALAEPMTRTILGGEHKLFRSPILGLDIVNWLCTRVRICL
jgi:CubicO group peptidase (beta-lactamase class C family)